MIASSTESEIWSAILSGCPSVTDSDVNRNSLSESLLMDSWNLYEDLARSATTGSVCVIDAHRADPRRSGLMRSILRRRAESGLLDERREPVQVEKDYRGRLLEEIAHARRERARSWRASLRLCAPARIAVGAPSRRMIRPPREA